jgi:hypothetical protein
MPAQPAFYLIDIPLIRFDREDESNRFSYRSG